MKIGFLGGGQLARMMALAGYPLGLTFRCIDPNPESPASDLMEFVHGHLDDPTALAIFAKDLDHVTIESENIPVATLEYLLKLGLKVNPGVKALAVSQDRLHEKSLFQQLGIPTAEFLPIASLSELQSGIENLGGSCILKTRRGGYDGRGQFRIKNLASAEEAWSALGGRELILERWLPFNSECSLIAVREAEGEVRYYPLTHNIHQDGILFSSEPFRHPEQVRWQLQAEVYAAKVLRALDYVGVLTIEFFALGDRLVANEMAPRVHNSGHWTIEAATTSQFENHLRAIIGWPLGGTAIREDFLMLNLIGQIPACNKILAIPGLHLHDYHKSPKTNRKLGHMTLLNPNPSRRSETVKLISS